jgi:hypothetical protein
MVISGSHVIVHADTYLGMEGNLKVSNTSGLIIKPDAFVTTKGNLSLTNESRGLLIESDATGTGSYIVNGNVSHPGYGSAKVQTYITGTVGSYYMHFVSATVEDTTPTSYNGTDYSNAVRLQQFDMTYLDTYAYYWDGTAPDISNYQGWVNIWPYDYKVPLGWGLALTNDSTGTGTIEMVGYPKSGDISFTTHYVAGNGYELIGNPYTAAIDFEDFYADNNSDITGEFEIYDATATGNFFQYVHGTSDPDDAFIQVGQAFFVHTRSGTSSVTFSNSHRSHSNVAYRSEIPNRLKLNVEGGTLGFKDQLYIRFDPEATGGYDFGLEALKWRSISDGATMIYSIAEDDSAMAINVLPLVDLNTTMTTVPVNFECGEEATYTFTFKGVSSFESDAEIWLEDKLAGDGFEDNWTYIPEDGFQYVFTGAPDDPKDRFNIHFFGPTSTPEDNINPEGSMKIYASGMYAYIMNNTKETIKQVSVYDLMGKNVYTGTLPEQTLNKLFVSDRTGYYVVRVNTDQNTYTQKVLIFNQ